MATVTDGLPEALEGFRGDVLRADDDGYDEARRIHNGLIDRRPAADRAVLRDRRMSSRPCSLPASRELEISVRGGGHNVVGTRDHATAASMIDLSAMRGVHVDPVARDRAASREGPGGPTSTVRASCTASPSRAARISTTGVGGLTLGGGLGWLDERVRAGSGQPRLRRGRDRRRTRPDGQRERAPRPLLGAQGRRRQLRGRPLVPRSGCTRWGR